MCDKRAITRPYISALLDAAMTNVLFSMGGLQKPCECEEFVCGRFCVVMRFLVIFHGAFIVTFQHITCPKKTVHH